MDRNFILDEIRRTAELNGGKPLGRLRLESEAGIKEYHWNQYWARYNDAVLEAGLSPNSVQGPIGEVALLQTLIQMARQLGRFPAQSDITQASASGTGVPSLKTFVTTLGNKPDMLKKLASYCEQTAGHEDVLQMCAEAQSTGNGTTSKEVAPNTFNDGFVYLLKSGKHYKIGKTNHLGRREYELSIQLPQQASTVHHIRTDDPDGIEAYWHKRFADKRKNGEWFELSTQDVSAFRRRKFM